jgi:lipoprotein-releasing system permease protein
MLAKKKQTCFILLGIFLGTCGFVTLSGFLLGWQEYFTREMVQNDAHLFIRANKQPIQEHDLDRFFYPEKTILSWITPPVKNDRSEFIENPKKWVEILKADPRISAFSPRFSALATFSFGEYEIFTSLIGCYPEHETEIKNLKQCATQGKFEDISIGSNRLAIGEGLAKQLNIKLYQTIMVSIAQDPPVPFKIVSIFHSKNYLTNSQAYGLLNNVQKIAKKPNQINEIAIKLYNHNLASKIASSWFYLGREKIESWDQLYAEISKMCLMNNAIRFATTGIIMLVAGFGIYNVLNMSVLDRAVL